MLNIKLTNHFTSRYRRRIAQVKQKDIDLFDFKYILWLRKECSKYLAGSKKISYEDIPSEIKIKYKPTCEFYVFQHKILFIASRVKENDSDLILLLTVYKINLSSDFYLLS